MSRNLKTVICLTALTVFAAGCSTFNVNDDKTPPEVKGVYTAEPVKLDGDLTEKAWQKAPAYKLDTVGKAEIRENGEYKFLWDKDNLYIGADFSDSDIYAYGEKDGMHHYLPGDVAEVFIKPESDTYHWELYATPTGKKTSFFIPGRGALLGPLLESDPIKIQVAAKSRGTINNWRDRDQGWTAEMAIPRRELEKYGAKFGPGLKWRVFVARYNYSRYLSWAELSSHPRQIRGPNFHLLEDYARLQLLTGTK